MGRSVNWEDEWEEEEGLVVGELGRRMVAEGWSMGEEALVKKRRVTGSESMALAWVSKNSIAPELSQIQPFSSYLDSAKCNRGQNTKAAWVHARYKCVAQQVKPVPLWDGSIPGAGLDWRGRVIARAVPIPDPWDEWFIPKFSHGARGGRLTPERLRKLRIGSIFWPKEKGALLGMLSNREYALSWTWEELGTISDEVEPPHRIRLESGHKVWNDRVFRILKKVIPVEKEMLEERVLQGLFEPA
jgi:hypothetical protein